MTLRAKLPIVQEEVTRTLRMVDGENVVYVESQLENLMGFDPPINWGSTPLSALHSWNRA